MADVSRTEALRIALERVWDGAERIDAEAVMDHLADQGFELIQMSATRAASRRGNFDELPFASTAGLPKMRSV